MKHTEYSQIGKWKVEFTSNVHMYCHSLSASKGDLKIEIQCEDLPVKDSTIGIWLYDLDITVKQIDELKAVFLKWADEKNICCRLYTSRDEYTLNSKFS